MTQKIMIIAGEASGDQRGAELVTAVLERNKNIAFFGVGGDEMRRAGVHIVIDYHQLLVMGFVEVVRHLPRIFKIMARVKELLRTERPDLLILVDYPGFNLRIAAYAKKLGIKVLFYISPQVWAWRQGRVKKIVKMVDHMAVVFPFEKKCYEGYAMPVTYVGHPLVAKTKKALAQQEARAALRLPNQLTIGLLPGSRYSTLERLLPILLESVERLASVFPTAQFVLAKAATISQDSLQAMLASSTIPLKIVDADALNVMSAADVIITVSGTATLEAALLNKPMVVIYHANPLSVWLARRLVKIPYVSLCNIVVGESVVTELLQENFTVDNLVCEVRKILEDRVYHETMISKLSLVNTILADVDTGERLSEIVFGLLY